MSYENDFYNIPKSRSILRILRIRSCTFSYVHIFWIFVFEEFWNLPTSLWDVRVLAVDVCEFGLVKVTAAAVQFSIQNNDKK